MLFADDLLVLASFEHGLQYAIDRFFLLAAKQE